MDNIDKFLEKMDETYAPENLFPFRMKQMLKEAKEIVWAASTGHGVSRQAEQWIEKWNKELGNG